MTNNIINPNFRITLIFNVIKIFAVFLSYQSSGMWQGMRSCFNTSFYPSVQSVIRSSGPLVRVMAVGAVLPCALGYNVRKFEDTTEFTGRDVFQGEIPHDLSKMAHYAFHICIVGSMAFGILKYSQTLSSDIRMASIIAGTYFYAVGRAWVMSPAESRLMEHCKYLPASCLGIIAYNRIPIIKEYMPAINALVGMSSSIHILGFH